MCKLYIYIYIKDSKLIKTMTRRYFSITTPPFCVIDKAQIAFPRRLLANWRKDLLDMFRNRVEMEIYAYS